MLDNLFGNMEEKQEAMRQKLAGIPIQAEVSGGAVRVSGNATREITEIKIDREKLDWDDAEQVEDLVLVAVNEFMERAAGVEAQESQRLIQDMLPPGMAGMFGG